MEEKEWSEEELMALLEKKKKDKFEQEEKEEDEAKDNLEHGAGVFETETETETETDGQSEEEEDTYEIITVDGVEYQLNKDDLTVISVDDFSPVGMWNKETSKIDFDMEFDDE